MKNTALLVLDFINDIVHPDGKIAGSATFVKEHHIIENANRVIAFARKNTIPIVFVKVGFNKNYLDCPVNSPVFSYAKKQQALQLDTWGTEFHETIDYQPTDLVVTKHRVSAFYSTSLEAFLRAHHIENIIIAGMSTDMAVQLTAREAHDRDYHVTIVSDACGAASQELHEHALKSLQKIALITTVDELKN